MGTRKAQKLNQLQRLLPEGLVVDARWLKGKGYSNDLQRRYRNSGWLEQPVRGVYRRPGGELLWQHVVISLQSLLEIPVIVGGRTALELYDFSHYISIGRTKEVHLYSDKPLPGWVGKLDLDARFVFHNARKLFGELSITQGVDYIGWNLVDQVFTGVPMSDYSLAQLSWGHWNWSLTLSTPERAILELLHEVPERETFHQADMLMESLRTLSPRRVQKLLENCRNVKVKRLFLWFAERHQFSWLSTINPERIGLGKGKRMLVRGGKLDPKYLITVPRDLDGG